MTATARGSAPIVAPHSVLFPSMRVAQVHVIDRAARALTGQMDELEDAGLLFDATAVRVAVDGLYRTRAKLVELLRRDGLAPPPVPTGVVETEDAVGGRCSACRSAIGQEHMSRCSL